MRASVWFLSAAAAAWVGGVAHAGAPEVWQPDEAMTYANPVQGEVSGAPWWVSFDDPQLSAFIDEGLANNGDLAASYARMQRAEALTVQVRGGLLPQIAVSSSLSGSPVEQFLFQIGQTGDVPDSYPSVLYSGSAYLTASYPIDLFGRTVLNTLAAGQSAQASADDLASLRLSMSIQIAEAYFDLLAAREQLHVQEQQVGITRDLLEIMELRFEGAQVTGVDVLQQRASLAGSQSQLPQTRAQIAVLERRLQVLLGRQPGEALEAFEAAVPPLPPSPATGAPSDLLQNRPDLRAASSRLNAATDTRRSASLGYLPSLSAQAQYGVQGRTDLAAYAAAAAAEAGASQRALAEADINADGFFADWATQDTWSVGLNLSVPLFTGGRTYGAHQVARADERSAAATLQQSTLAAVAQVENALQTQVFQQAQAEAVRTQLEASRLAFEQSRARYIEGLESYLTVLTAQGAYRQAELSSVVVRRALLSTRLQLHAALGGPWTHSEP